MKHDDVLLVCVNAIENGPQIIERVVISNHHERVSRPHLERLRRQILARFEIELVEPGVSRGTPPRRALRHRENREEDPREGHSCIRRHLLGEQIDDTQPEQDDRDHRQAKGDLGGADPHVEGHAKVALTGLPVAKHQHRKAFQRKAPHHPERVGFSKQENVSPAQDDREDLKPHDEVQNVVRGPETTMRVTKPRGENAVLGHPVQDAIRPHD